MIFKWRRWLWLFAGVNLIGLSVNMFLRSGLGSDPLTVLQQGMHFALKISIGQASILYNIVILITALLFAKRALGLGTVAHILLVGSFIDGYSILLRDLMPGEALASRLAWLIIAQLTISAGLAFIIHASLGTNGMDAILLTLEQKTPIPYQALRTVADVLFTLFGMLMGGIAGLGTAFSMLSTGLLVAVFRRLLRNVK